MSLVGLVCILLQVMIVRSFIRDGFGLRPIEVELSVVPGLPQMKFLGLPDALIRESEARIKAALRNQGFEIPSSKQILVQLRPSEVKKNSRGLDLAVAAAFLWETNQIPRPKTTNQFLYGELNFNGEVRAPDDFCDIETLSEKESVITGRIERRVGFEFLQVAELKNLCKPHLVESANHSLSWHPPDLKGLMLSKEQSRLATIIATGEHPTIFAGPPGSGKSTLADYISKLVEPDFEQLKLSSQIARYFGESLEWIPVRRPHHKSTLLSMIGAGRPPQPGEVTRAHGGVLIMDEFLEFESNIQEALREPLESGKILVSRAGAAKEFPARFLLLATTNLCPCGQFVPTSKSRCRCRSIKKRLYIEKLSGPLIDRFHVISFSDEYSQRHEVPLIDLKDKVSRARKFALESRGQLAPNSQLGDISYTKDVSLKAQNIFKLKVPSQRRLKSTLQVARTIADLSQSLEILPVHLNEAVQISLRSATKIQVDLQKFI